MHLLKMQDQDGYLQYPVKKGREKLEVVKKKIFLQYDDQFNELGCFYCTAISTVKPTHLMQSCLVLPKTCKTCLKHRQLKMYVKWSYITSQIKQNHINAQGTKSELSWFLSNRFFRINVIQPINNPKHHLYKRNKVFRF